MISKPFKSEAAHMQPPRPRPADLPNFERPPVTEIVLSIQFAALPAFRAFHVGLLWERLRQEYPNASEQPPLAPVFETFGAALAFAPPRLEIQTLLSPPMHRFWFETADGRELLQVQQDRVLHNWRKREREQEYPRYETVRERFVSDLGVLGDFLDKEGLGEVRPNQCEVNYINSIELVDSDNPYSRLERITPLWTGRFAENYGNDIENTAIQSRFVLRQDGGPYGRVYVSFTPAVLPVENRSVVRLDITVRAKPREETLESAFDMLDQAREIVVRTFAAVTTPELWEMWGRTNAK